MNWSKIATLTDIHFGKKSDSDVHNRDCLDYLEWFCDRTREHDADAVCVIGDWNDSRSRIRVDTWNHSYRGAKMLDRLKLPIYWVLGNHDLFYRDNRTLHSLPWLDDIEMATVVGSPLVVGDTLFCPWLCTTDEMKAVAQMRARYVFGHFGFPGFMMNAKAAAPDHGQLDPGWWERPPEYIFSGHFHRRQFRSVGHTMVHYTGNCFPHDFSDEGDRERGMMVLERDGSPTYIDWPGAPTYHRVMLSEVLEDVEGYGRKATVRAIQDVALTVTEREDLMEIMREHVREFSLEPMNEHKIVEQIRSAGLGGGTGSIESVVLEHIRSFDTSGTNLVRSRLEEIFVSARVG